MKRARESAPNGGTYFALQSSVMDAKGSTPRGRLNNSKSKLETRPVARVKKLLLGDPENAPLRSIRAGEALEGNPNTK